MSLLLGIVCLSVSGLFLNRAKNTLPYNVVSGLLLMAFAQVVELRELSELVNLSLCAVFICAGMGVSKRSKASGTLFLYSLLQYTMQWSLGIGIYLLVFEYFKTGPIVALVAPAGLAGGHGSAAFLGEVLKQEGHMMAYDKLMFCATVGVVIAVVGQIFFSKNKSVRYEAFSLGRFHSSAKTLIVVSGMCALSYFTSKLIFHILGVAIPYFIFGFLISLLARPILKLNSSECGGVSNFSSDLLITFGIASIKWSAIKEDVVAILLVIALTLATSVVLLKNLGLRLFKNDSELVGLFTWGWSMAGIAISMGGIKSIDTVKAQRAMEMFAPVYMLIAPIEVGILLLAPFLLDSFYMKLSLLVFGPVSLAIILKLHRQVVESA